MSHAERLPLVDVLHGVPVPDPYRWLEDPDRPETRAWLAAQDELWHRHAATLTWRPALRDRLARLADQGQVTAPVWRGDRCFFLRWDPGRQHPVLYARRAGDPEQALVDVGALDPSGLTTLDSWQPSLDGALLAYQISQGGTERAELHVVETASGREADGPIGWCRYSPVAWLAGGEGFYYVRDGQVRLRRIGHSDTPVFGTGRDAVTYGLGISHDGRWLAISATPGTAPRNDLWLADLTTDPPDRLRPLVVQQGLEARSAPVVGRDGRLYVITDLKAPRIRLCVGVPERPADWTELIPEGPEAVLTDFTILDGPELERPLLLAAWSRHAVSEISMHDLESGVRLGSVPLPGTGTVGPMSARPEGGHEAWFTYTDIATPAAVWRFDARTREMTLWAQAPGSVRLPNVRTHRVTCTSADGAPVRITIVAREGRTGPRPTILYGYGGFGVPLTPSYAADSLAWLEAGGVLAIAHLRGGGEDGLTSHHAGMLEHKQRVFDDFIAAAEHLVADGWTTPGELGIWGESNGGLLVGAVLTQRPELFAAAVCMAPLLDMVRYERFGLGAAWRGEYGTAEDPAEFQQLLAYSPYHNVREGGAYPATLFATFGGDTRVDPMHARKMCAALQWASGGDHPIVLRHEHGVGHGARSAARSCDLAADMLAFMAAHTGLQCMGVVSALSQPRV